MNETAINLTNQTTPAIGKFQDAVESGLFQESFKFFQSKVSEFIVSMNLVPEDTYFLLCIILLSGVIVLLTLSKGANTVNSGTKYIIYAIITAIILIGLGTIGAF